MVNYGTIGKRSIEELNDYSGLALGVPVAVIIGAVCPHEVEIMQTAAEVTKVVACLLALSFESLVAPRAFNFDPAGNGLARVNARRFQDTPDGGPALIEFWSDF